MAFVRE